jgi:hypothetical protein
MSQPLPPRIVKRAAAAFDDVETCTIDELRETLGLAEQSAPTPSLCHRHGLPAVCFGADLAFPKRRCPRCCRADPQFGGIHGVDNYLNGHEYAEGVSI